MNSSSDPALKIASAAAGGLFSYLGTKLSDWLSNKKEAELLKRISIHFRSILKIPKNPDNTEINPYANFINYSPTINTFLTNQQNTGDRNYFDKPRLLAATIEDYLDARERRWFGSGNEDDALTIVLNELHGWASTTLPTLGYNTASQKKIKLRLEYVDIFLPNTLFKLGWFSRESNKKSTFMNIRNILKSCADICSIEKEKLTVRQYLNTCRGNAVQILNDCIEVLYLSGDKNAYKNTLNKKNFLEHQTIDARIIGESESKIYKTLAATHNGKMLKDVILMCGLDQDGIPDNKNNSCQSQYFDAYYQPQPVNWQSAKTVVFPWISVTDQAQYTHIQLLQQFAAMMLDFAELIQILEKAHTASGAFGDEWASIAGKEDLLTCLGDFDASMLKLTNALKVYLDSNIMPWHSHNIANRDKDWDLNFGKMKVAISSMQSKTELLIESTAEIRKIIQEFPTKCEKHKEEEIKFHQQVAKRKARNNKTGIAEPLDANVPGDDQIDNSSRLASAFTSFRFRLESVHSSRSIASKALKTFFASLPDSGIHQIADWKVGNSYEAWARTFVSRHETFFTEYNEKLELIDQALQNTRINPRELLEQQRTVIDNLFTDLRSKLESEAPRWRFWPVFTLGYPFNRTASTFTQLLRNELNSKYDSVTNFINTKIDHCVDPEPEKPEEEYEEEHKEEYKEEKYPSAYPVLQTEKIDAAIQRSQAIGVLFQQHNSVPPLASVPLGLSHSPIAVPTFAVIQEDKYPDEKYADEEKEVTDIRPQTYDEWCPRLYSKYSDWAREDYATQLSFFENVEDINRLLNSILACREELDRDLIELARDNILDIQKELIAAMNDPVIKTSQHKKNWEQLKLLYSFLNVTIEISPQRLEAEKDKLIRYANSIFNIPSANSMFIKNYPQHGLLRKSNPPVTPVLEYKVSGLQFS